MHYRCNLCPFQTNQSSFLEVHMEVHVEGKEQSWERSSKNWLPNEPRTSQPKDILYISGMRLVTGKGKEVICEEKIHSSSDDDEGRYQEEPKMYESSPGSNQYYAKPPKPKEVYPVKSAESKGPQDTSDHVLGKRISTLFQK